MSFPPPLHPHPPSSPGPTLYPSPRCIPAHAVSQHTLCPSLRCIPAHAVSQPTLYPSCIPAHATPSLIGWGVQKSVTCRMVALPLFMSRVEGRGLGVHVYDCSKYPSRLVTPKSCVHPELISHLAFNQLAVEIWFMKPSDRIKCTQLKICTFFLTKLRNKYLSSADTIS